MLRTAGLCVKRLSQQTLPHCCMHSNPRDRKLPEVRRENHFEERARNQSRPDRPNSSRFSSRTDFRQTRSNGHAHQTNDSSFRNVNNHKFRGGYDFSSRSSNRFEFAGDRTFTNDQRSRRMSNSNRLNFEPSGGNFSGNRQGYARYAIDNDDEVADRGSSQRSRRRPRYSQRSLESEYRKLEDMGMDMDQMDPSHGNRWSVDHSLAMPELTKTKSREDRFRRYNKARHMRIKRTYFREHLHKEPNLLTWAAKEQIKFLHNLNPERWTAHEISLSFPISEQGARLLFKVRSFYTDPDHIKKHDQLVAERWTALQSMDARNSLGDAAGGPIVSADQMYRYWTGQLSLHNGSGMPGLPVPRKLPVGENADDDATSRSGLVCGKFSSILLKYVDFRQNELAKKVQSKQQACLPLGQVPADYVPLRQLQETESRRQPKLELTTNPLSVNTTTKFMPESADAGAHSNGKPSDEYAHSPLQSKPVYKYLGYEFDAPVNPEYIQELLDGHIKFREQVDAAASGGERRPHSIIGHEQAKERILGRVKRTGDVATVQAYEEYFSRKDWELEQREAEETEKNDDDADVAREKKDADESDSKFFTFVPKFNSQALTDYEERSKNRHLLLEKRALAGLPPTDRDSGGASSVSSPNDDDDIDVDQTTYNAPEYIHIPEHLRQPNAVYRKSGALYDADGKLIRRRRVRDAVLR